MGEVVGRTIGCPQNGVKPCKVLLLGDLVDDATLVDDNIGETLLTREGISDREDNKNRYGGAYQSEGN